MHSIVCHQFLGFFVCKTMPSLSCQLCEKHYSTHDWTVHLCWFEKKTSRCQKYLEISSFMLNFGKPLTKIFSVLFKNVYHCPTQSWHGGSAHRKTKHPQLFYEKKAKINHIAKVEGSRNNTYWVRCVTDHALK